MKPNYKALTPQQWEEIFLAGATNYSIWNDKIKVVISESRVSFYSFREVFVCEFSMHWGHFTLINELFNSLEAFRKMSEYIDIGIGNNMPEISEEDIKNKLESEQLYSDPGFREGFLTGAMFIVKKYMNHFNKKS